MTFGKGGSQKNADIWLTQADRMPSIRPLKISFNIRIFFFMQGSTLILVISDTRLSKVIHDDYQFPLTPMGVLAHRLRTLDRSLVPPSA